jgi:hypothetical protein
MGFGILNGTSIGLLNLSLGFNSVGFYQVTYSNLSSIFCDCNIILFYQWGGVEFIVCLGWSGLCLVVSWIY